MNLAETRFRDLIKIASDINYHLPILFEYAKKCGHVTEFGVRTGVSTMAFLSACPKRLVSYDLFHDVGVAEGFKEAREMGLNYDYKIENVLETEIEETDLLFIDTFHTEDQIQKELSLHASKVKKYIIFHDVETYGWIGEDGGCGILRKILEFITLNTGWKPIYYSRFNNGLLVIEKC
jgi:predicted O-methyltransferase YrrM